MSGRIEQSLEFIVSSGQGSSYNSADGSKFTVELDQPLTIPREAENIQLAVLGASVWWNTINIVEDGINNVFMMYVNTRDQPAPGSVGFTPVPTLHNVTLRAGLYDVEAVYDAIVAFLIAANVDPLRAQTCIRLWPDNVRDRICLQLSGSNEGQGGIVQYPIYMMFNAGCFWETLFGFDPNIIPYEAGTNSPAFPVPTVMVYVATNPADVNPVDYFVVHSDLTAKGHLFNGKYQQIVAQVPIKGVRPGTQITYVPNVAPRCDAQNLAGIDLKSFRMWLTDQVGLPVETSGKLWSVRMAITYVVPAVI
jgi:hypothetical protein